MLAPEFNTWMIQSEEFTPWCFSFFPYRRFIGYTLYKVDSVPRSTPLLSHCQRANPISVSVSYQTPFFSFLSLPHFFQLNEISESPSFSKKQLSPIYFLPSNLLWKYKNNCLLITYLTLLYMHFLVLKLLSYLSIYPQNNYLSVSLISQLDFEVLEEQYLFLPNFK